MNGNWNDPWIGEINYTCPIAPDENNTLTLCERNLYYGFSYSGRIYYSYGTDKTWREIKYAKNTDLTIVNNNISEIFGHIDNINNSMTAVNNKLNIGVLINYITINDINIQSGETDIQIDIPAIDNYRPIGIIGVDYGDLRHVYITQFNLQQSDNYTAKVLIGLYSSRAVSETLQILVLYTRRDACYFQYTTSSYTIIDNK